MAVKTLKCTHLIKKGQKKRNKEHMGNIETKNINMVDTHNHIKVMLNINNLNTPIERLHKNSRWTMLCIDYKKPILRIKTQIGQK